jgi:hypothetical protein
MKKGLDLKFYMMTDPNNKTFNPSFIKFDLYVKKLFFLFHIQTDAKRNDLEPWSYDDFGLP